MGRPHFPLALRVEVLVIFALALSITGVVLARVASTPTWHNVVFPPVHGPSLLPKVDALSMAVPGWVVFVVVVGFGALWTGCGWVLLRHKVTAALP